MAVLLMFFVSGAVALLYEIAWFRRLQLVFGVSSFAIGAVISAFMLGLALGSRWAASIPVLLRRPLLAYAILELALAIYAQLFLPLVHVIERFYSLAFPFFGGHFLTLSGFRFALSLLLLLLPTCCMGATLPILTRLVAPDASTFAPRVASLYGLNTLGGVFGTLLSGFWSLEHLGIRGTIWLGAAANLSIACVAFLLSRRTLPLVPVVASASKVSPFGKVGSDGRFAMLVVGITGFVSMALEMVWTRGLVFYTHNSTYAFSAILAIYLLGLGAGTLLGIRLSRSSSLLSCLAATLVALCFMMLLGIAVYRGIPHLFKPLLGQQLPSALAGLPERSFGVVRNWSTALTAIFLETSAILLAPAILFGLVFPLALAVSQREQTEPAALTGKLYAVNTIGSVIGTVAGAFVLIPLFGTRGALILLAWLPLPLALATWRRSKQPTKVVYMTATLVCGSLVLLTLLCAPAQFYRKMFADRFGDVLWFSEGISETVAVCRHPDGSAWIHYSDGRGASGTTSFRGGWLYAHLPLLLHPDPRSALVICFGTGNTLAAARLHPLERVEGVELSRDVVKASIYFQDTNHRVAQDPNVRITIEDGRNYLLGTQKRFDVITEEPPLVHTAGVVNLYSKDFYQLCNRHLTENGIMAVWLATWELEDREVRMLVRAFADAFPHTSIWGDGRQMGEWILIGSKQPLQVDPANLQRRMAAAALAPDLAKLEISSAADLLALYLKGQEFVNDYTAGVPPVTDDRSVVDYTIPRQARANFGLGDFTTGGFYVSGVGPNGLVSELRVRDFDAIYTMRDSADSLVAPASPQNRNAFTDELARRRLEAERRCGQKIAWNATAMAADFWLLGQREKSFQALDSGIGIVDPAAKVDLLLSKASLFRRNGQLAEARETARKALVIEPSNSQALKFVSELNR